MGTPLFHGTMLPCEERFLPVSCWIRATSVFRGFPGFMMHAGTEIYYVLEIPIRSRLSVSKTDVTLRTLLWSRSRWGA